MSTPQTLHRSAKPFSDADRLQFPIVMATVVFVRLIVFMTDSKPYHCGGLDLAKVSHPVSMPGADWDNALLVAVTRDGQLYFGSDQITPDSLPDRIRERLKDREVESKAYIRADIRARWGSGQTGP